MKQYRYINKLCKTIKMKEAQVHKTDGGDINVKVADVSEPTEKDLKPDQVLIKVHVSGSNPKVG